MLIELCCVVLTVVIITALYFVPQKTKMFLFKHFNIVEANYKSNICL